MLFLSFRTTHINIVCEPERIGSLEFVSDAKDGNYVSKKNMVRLMIFDATFNNITVISWWSVLLVEKTTDLLQVTDNFIK
jgi:hypothetical protein